MCPCSSCHGGGLSPVPLQALTWLPQPSHCPPWAEDRGHYRCCTLTFAAMQLSRSPRDAQGPLVWGLPAQPPLGNTPCPSGMYRRLTAPQGCPQYSPYPTGRAPASPLSTHPVSCSHRTPHPKGSPGPLVPNTCPSHGKNTHSSSQNHKTPRVPMMFFLCPPQHHNLLCTHHLSPTFAVGQPGTLERAQKIKKQNPKKYQALNHTYKPLIT